jgi:acyl-CoA thioester hydrolase
MSWLITHRLTVRFRDCDPLGHVNNAVYLTYLEQARFHLWRAQFGYVARAAGEGGRRGLGFILARAEIDFTAQARYGDELDVHLGLDSVRRSSFTYVYEIANVETQQVIAKARTVQVRFDYDAQQPVAVDDVLKGQLAEPVAPTGGLKA